jgi:hypothetical protein
MARPRFLPDNFTLALLTTVGLASILPCRGETAQVFDKITDVAVALLFFLHGAKLSREAVIAGITHWRLHVVVLLCTFAMFPLLGLLLKPALLTLISPDLYLGVLFLCTLPSTVQSSIAFTSMARGNVPAAVCSASASSMLGIFLTPLLVGLMVVPQSGTAISAGSFVKIVVQLLLPFVAGQVARTWIGNWIGRHAQVLRPVDQGSILLVVYRVQPGRGRRHLAPSAGFGLVLPVDHQFGAAGDRPAADYAAEPAAGFRQRGRSHHCVLRFQEKPGQWRADCQGSVPGPCHWHHGAAADAVPPNPADGLCRAGATLCPASR